jgi:hypothetical protein
MPQITLRTSHTLFILTYKSFGLLVTEVFFKNQEMSANIKTKCVDLVQNRHHQLTEM